MTRLTLIAEIADRGIIKGVAEGRVQGLTAADYDAIEAACDDGALVRLRRRDDGGWIAEHRDYGRVGGDADAVLRELGVWLR